MPRASQAVLAARFGGGRRGKIAKLVVRLAGRTQRCDAQSDPAFLRFAVRPPVLVTAGAVSRRGHAVRGAPNFTIRQGASG
jgi:hypothetical protein